MRQTTKAKQQFKKLWYDNINPKKIVPRDFGTKAVF
jgi:hypothetical protein